jgi:hypothetical protein
MTASESASGDSGDQRPNPDTAQPIGRPPLVNRLDELAQPLAGGPRIELFGDRDVFAIEFEVVSIMEWSGGTKDLEGFASYWVGGHRFGYRDVGPQPLSEWLHGLEELSNFDFSENAEYLVECSAGELVSRVFNGCYWPGAGDEDFAESMRRHDLTSIATRALDGLCVIAVDHGETSSIYAVGEELCKRLRAYKPVPSQSVVVVQLPRAEKDIVLKTAYTRLVAMLREVGHPG